MLMSPEMHCAEDKGNAPAVSDPPGYSQPFSIPGGEWLLIQYIHLTGTVITLRLVLELILPLLGMQGCT